MKVIVFLFILCTSISFSQFSDDLPLPSPQSSNPITFEAIPYLSNDTSTIQLIVFYRINPKLFFFAKAGTAQQDIYRARGELVFEIFDEKDAAISREFRPLLIERSSLPTEDSPFSEELQGVLTFKLKKGLYRIVVETKDNESGRSFINRDTKIDARIFSSGLAISSPLFVESISSSTSSNKENIFIPINRSGGVIIGQTGRCLVQVISPDTMTDIHLTWNVISRKETDEDNPQQLTGEKYFQQFGTPADIENPKQASISILPNSKHSRMFIISIPIERLETGRYQMRIALTQGSLKSEKDFSFNVIWPLKPHSLSDSKIAVDALRHIATEAELDSITAFSSSQAKRAFDEFWKRRNPDTTRAFNPVMAEYYRRVDETLKRFSSINEADGYRTDRGRIYILFGSPSLINRLLKPNAVPTEIWTYEKLHRRFTFTDQRKTGNYLLTKMENY